MFFSRRRTWFSRPLEAQHEGNRRTFLLGPWTHPSIGFLSARMPATIHEVVKAGSFNSKIQRGFGRDNPDPLARRNGARKNLQRNLQICPYTAGLNLNPIYFSTTFFDFLYFSVPPPWWQVLPQQPLLLPSFVLLREEQRVLLVRNRKSPATNAGGGAKLNRAQISTCVTNGPDGAAFLEVCNI